MRRIEQKLDEVDRRLNEQGWPEDVEEGRLRELLGVPEDEPLSGQYDSAESLVDDVEDLVQGGEITEREATGMLMFAANSNPDHPFWSNVKDVMTQRGLTPGEEQAASIDRGNSIRDRINEVGRRVNGKKLVEQVQVDERDLASLLASLYDVTTGEAVEQLNQLGEIGSVTPQEFAEFAGDLFDVTPGSILDVLENNQ